MGYVPLVDISGANALVSFIDRVKKNNGAKSSSPTSRSSRAVCCTKRFCKTD